MPLSEKLSLATGLNLSQNACTWTIFSDYNNLVTETYALPII